MCLLIRLFQKGKQLCFFFVLPFGILWLHLWKLSECISILISHSLALFAFFALLALGSGDGVLDDEADNDALLDIVLRFVLLTLVLLGGLFEPLEMAVYAFNGGWRIGGPQSRGLPLYFDHDHFSRCWFHPIGWSLEPGSTMCWFVTMSQVPHSSSNSVK